MAKIEVKNTAIIINNYTWGDCQRVENQFRVYDRLTHDYYYMGLYYDEENKRLYLPRGIDIWFVESAFQCKAEFIYKCDGYDHIDNCGLKYGPRDDVQKEALRFMVGALEYKDNEEASQLCINLSTGKGKTYMSIATMAYFEIKSMIITYSVNWLNQWKERIMEYTGISSKEILLVSGSATINRLMNMSQEQLKRYKVFLITHSTIKSYASNNGWEAIGEFFKHIRIGIKFYDEAHLNFLNMAMVDLFTNTYKTYYLTATPARSSEEENILYCRYFKNVKGIELFNEDNDPHTKYMCLRFNSHPTIFDIQECRNQYGLDRNGYINYLVGKDEYYQLLRIILDLALKKNGKCLIYIGTNAAIMQTYKWIMFNYPILADNVGIFTTLVSKEQKELEKEKKIILSTTKSAGAAMDIKGLKMTVVLNEPFKSQVTAQQSLGRTRDDDTYYIECLDIGFKQITKYYNYKRPVYDKYALSCSEISMSQEEMNMRTKSIINSITTMPLVNMPLVYFKQPKNLVSFY